MKDIEVSLSSRKFAPGETIRGTVRVGYNGRFDGVVVNTQILDSNELVVYRSCAGREIEKNVSRLFVPREAMSADGPTTAAEFTASIEFAAARDHDVKFRASIIEQHKEVESDIVFARLRAGRP